jgi:flagellar basal-body rod protein FlgC
MDVLANNIANAETTRTADGQPYKRQETVFTPIRANTARTVAAKPGAKDPTEAGVQVAAIITDEKPPKMVYDPGHPDADANGYVAFPDIDIITEMTDMISATRAYEANVTALNAAKSMATKALEISRG